MTLHGTVHLHPAHHVGPVRRRTFGTETNAFGLDEFLSWALIRLRTRF